jgi:hypothetical protein
MKGPVTIFLNTKRSFVELMNASKLYRYAALLSALLVLLSFLLPAWRIVPLAQSQPYLPLHYNIYFGIDRFGPWYFVFFPALLGLILLLLNLIFQVALFKREHVLSLFFSISTVFTELILFIAVVFIVLLNI